MKNIWKKLAAISTAAVMCVGVGMLAACTGKDGTNGKDGVNGVTPHIGTNGNWFIGNTDTGVKAEGTDGKNGSNGTNGSNGITPSIGANGNWFLGDTDTGVKAEGTDGKNGSNGSVPSIGDNGNWFIGDTDTGVKAEGTDGKNGRNGKDGIDGTGWFTGRGLPTEQILEGVKTGDFYINLNTNTIYIMSDLGWQVLVNVNEQNNVSVWDGTIPGWQAPNLSDEEIIENRPVSYVVNEKTIDIYNAEAFAWFAYRAVIGKTGYEGYTVNLHCDVDLDNKMWIPIGLGARSNAAGEAFKGTFNGNGHTIYNLNGTAFLNAIQYGTYENILGVEEPTQETGYYVHYVNETDDGKVDVNIPIKVKDDESGDEVNFGLFANSYNATFRNLNIENVTVDFTQKQLKENGEPKLIADSVGALLGFGLGNLTVENCTTGSANGNDSIKAYTTAAGLVGRCYAGTGENPDKGGVIDGTKAPYGKITIKDCTNYIDIALDGEKLDKAAGIIAFPNRFSEVIITDCENHGDIVGGYAGGLIGYSDAKVEMPSPVSIKDCANYGAVTGNYAGGLIGHRGSISKGSNASYSIIGFTNKATITAKYVCKALKSDKTEVPENERKVYAGGIAGDFLLNSARVIVTDCFNYGDVTAEPEANTYLGGFFGMVSISKPSEYRQGNIVISGLNFGNITVEVAENKNIKAYGFGYVNVASGLEVNAVYKQIYFFNSGLITDEITTKGDNTNLNEYNANI